jgi:hypothetical protein
MSAIVTLPVMAQPSDEDIQASIDLGISWLVGNQNLDGSWGAWPYDVAYTGFALIKLQDRAYELGYEDPFDPEYPYSDNVIAGWEYIFKTDPDGVALRVLKRGMVDQDHTGGASGTLDDPDSNGNGYGLTFGTYDHTHTYTTGIVLMALEASGTPSRSCGVDFDGDGVPDSFFDVAQDAVDWLSFAQGDSGHDEGGWFYTADSAGAPRQHEASGSYDTDNSNGGYAVLGLAAAEGFGCGVPDWVKTELDVWIITLQDPVDGDADDGGSWYRPEWSWVNELKTGNLIFEMTFYGDDPSVGRFQDALDYIVRHWNDQNQDPGWRGSWRFDNDGDGSVDEDPFNGVDDDGDGLIDEDSPVAHYQAMYCLMKGFEYSQVDLIDLDGVGDPEHDWYAEFAQCILDGQHPDGHWGHGNWGDDFLNTVWALLTLEKVTPPPPTITVSVDIKPGSWPNPFNKKAKGVFVVAICGTEDFDVTEIDPGTVELVLSLEDSVAVSPLRWTYEDVATPYEDMTPDDPDGHELEGDGYLDLVFHFKRQEVVGLGLCEYSDGEYVKLYLVGNLKGENGEGPPIRGFDWIRVQFKEGKGKGKP